MPTRAEADKEETRLDEYQQRSLYVLIVSSGHFSASGHFDLQKKLAFVSGVDAQLLGALLTKGDDDDTLKLKGGKEGLDIDTVRDQDRLAAKALALLYGTSSRAGGIISISVVGQGLAGWCDVDCDA